MSQEPKFKAGHKLKTYFDEEHQQFIIEGNKAGLEYLISVCQKIIEVEAPGEHWHFSNAFYSLEKGSTEFIIYITDFESNNLIRNNTKIIV